MVRELWTATLRHVKSISYTPRLGQKTKLTEETEVLDTVIGQIEDESRRSSKSHLISQAANLIQIAQQVCKQPMPSVVTGAVPADFLR